MHLSLTSKLRLVFILSFSHFSPFITPIATPPVPLATVWHCILFLCFCLLCLFAQWIVRLHLRSIIICATCCSTQLASPRLASLNCLPSYCCNYCCCCCCCCESLGVVQAATAAATAAATGWNQSRKTKLETKSKLKQKQKPEAFVRKIQSLISVWPAN